MSYFCPIYVLIIWLPHSHKPFPHHVQLFTYLLVTFFVIIYNCSSPFLLPVILYYIEGFCLVSRSIHDKEPWCYFMSTQTTWNEWQSRESNMARLKDFPGLSWPHGCGTVSAEAGHCAIVPSSHQTSAGKKD